MAGIDVTGNMDDAGVRLEWMESVFTTLPDRDTIET